MRGAVKRINERGFCFVSPEDATSSKDEHFLHARDLLGIQSAADWWKGDAQYSTQ